MKLILKVFALKDFKKITVDQEKILKLIGEKKLKNFCKIYINKQKKKLKGIKNGKIEDNKKIKKNRKIELSSRGSTLFVNLFSDFS